MLDVVPTGYGRRHGRQGLGDGVSLEWETVEELGLRKAFGKLADVFVAAGEQQRLAFADQVQVRILARPNGLSFDRDPAPLYVFAILACMPSTARVVALLTRPQLRTAWNSAVHEPEPLLRVLRARALPWLGELAVRLTERLPASGGGWWLTSALLLESGAVPPVTEGVVRGWLRDLLRPRGLVRHPPLATRLRDDPWLDLLLPAVFEIDGLGDAAAQQSWDATADRDDPRPVLPLVVAELVAEGRLDRRWILAATVDRLARGDRTAALRTFVMQFDTLAPTVDELAGFQTELTRILGEAPSAVAGVAQRALLAVDAAGRLDLATLLEASGGALRRPEKALVKAQLTWLGKVAAREPGRAGEVLETAAAAFEHPALDIQDRALATIARHRTRLDTATTARLAQAATVLTGDVAARAAALFGPVPAATPSPVQAPPSSLPVVRPPAGMPALPSPPPPAMFPPPITDVAELAEEIVAIVHDESAVRWERVLAGLVGLTATVARDDLAAALDPVLKRCSAQLWVGPLRHQAPAGFLGEVIHAVLRPDQRGPGWARMTEAVRAAWDGGPVPANTPVLPAGPDGVLPLRVCEIAMNIAARSVPMLVSTPTHVDGNLDAETLFDRLCRAEADGWQPWPLDLEQALLRTPRAVAGDLMTRAATLTGPAGRRFAAWITAGGLPDPISTRWEQRSGPTFRLSATSPFAPRRVLANLAPTGMRNLRLVPRLVSMTRPPEPDWFAREPTLAADLRTMVLPHHREVIAAWGLPRIAALADLDNRGEAGLLPLLATAGGPPGPAMSLAVAYGLGARHDTDRVAAVDAFLTLAAGPDPFAARLGADLGDLCGDGTVKLTRVVPGLGDAHSAGASAAVWELLMAAVPVLLAPAPRGLPDLLMLAAQVASAVGARQQIPGLVEVAHRGGGTRLVREAKRLHDALHC
jgi:hypothetical protein